MRMIFGTNDETQFYAAREVLVAQFAEWLHHNSTGTRSITPDDNQATTRTAELALDWKWGSADGDLSLWTLRQLDEFLLEWIPRKVVMPAEDAALIPPDLNLFVTFLADSGLLSAKSSSVTSISSHLRQIVAPFQRALTDRSRHGMGKSLFGGLEQLGMTFDPNDPSSIGDLMASFNALSFEERGAILGLDDDDEHGTYNYEDDDEPDYFGDPFHGIPTHLKRWVELISGLDLPPALVLSQDQHRELASQTNVVAMFHEISSFFDRPRKLTKTGNLSVADGKLLAEILQSDARALQMNRKVQSSMDLPGLSFRIDWARECAVIKMVKGTMSSTATFKKRNATEQHQKAFTTLLDVGPLTFEGRPRWQMPNALGIIDDGVPALLAVLFALDGAPIPYATLLETTNEIMRESIQPGPFVSAEHVEERTAELFNELWLLFEMVGVVERVEFTATEEDQTANEDHTANENQTAIVGLRLTELGRVVVPTHLASLGMEIPEIGLFVHRPLDDVIANVSLWHRKRIETEFVAWVNANGVEPAITALTRIAIGTDDIQTRIAIVELAGSLGERSEAAVRGLLATKAGGHAQVWLLTNRYDEPNDGNMRRAMMASFELLSLHCTGDPDDDNEVLHLVLPVLDSIDPTEFFNLLWRVDEPWAGDVLAAVGRLHPDKAIAKQARKALMQHQTHMATRRQR